MRTCLARPCPTVIASLLLAACGGGRTATPAATPPGNTAPAAPTPAGPAPSIAWTGEGPDAPGEFVRTGLPAVTTDGANVVIADVAADGARGNPNLRLLVKDRTDTTVHEQIVLDPDTEQFAPPPGAVDAANEYLARTHAERGWIPLAVGAPVDLGDFEPRSTWTTGADGVEIVFEQRGHVTIRHEGATVVDRDVPGWLVPDTPMCDGCPDTCSNPPFLQSVAASAAHRIAVITIGYFGTDMCWEPDAVHHVVAW